MPSLPVASVAVSCAANSEKASATLLPLSILSREVPSATPLRTHSASSVSFGDAVEPPLAPSCAILSRAHSTQTHAVRANDAIRAAN